jgi:hypothetical protein
MSDDCRRPVLIFGARHLISAGCRRKTKIFDYGVTGSESGKIRIKPHEYAVVGMGGYVYKGVQAV